jgi:ABC-type arginine transport system ATPase subunit
MHVADSGSFTAAGARFDRTKSDTTQQMQRLSQQCGVRLFVLESLSEILSTSLPGIKPAGCEFKGVCLHTGQARKMSPGPNASLSGATVLLQPHAAQL